MAAVRDKETDDPVVRLLHRAANELSHGLTPATGYESDREVFSAWSDVETPTVHDVAEC